MDSLGPAIPKVGFPSKKVASVPEVSLATPVNRPGGPEAVCAVGNTTLEVLVSFSGSVGEVVIPMCVLTESGKVGVVVSNPGFPVVASEIDVAVPASGSAGPSDLGPGVSTLAMALPEKDGTLSLSVVSAEVVGIASEMALEFRDGLVLASWAVVKPSVAFTAAEGRGEEMTTRESGLLSGDEEATGKGEVPWYKVSGELSVVVSSPEDVPALDICLGLMSMSEGL